MINTTFSCYLVHLLKWLLREGSSRWSREPPWHWGERIRWRMTTDGIHSQWVKLEQMCEHDSERSNYVAYWCNGLKSNQRLIEVLASQPRSPRNSIASMLVARILISRVVVSIAISGYIVRVWLPLVHKSTELYWYCYARLMNKHIDALTSGRGRWRAYSTWPLSRTIQPKRARTINDWCQLLQSANVILAYAPLLKQDTGAVSGQVRFV